MCCLFPFVRDRDYGEKHAMLSIARAAPPNIYEFTHSTHSLRGMTMDSGVQLSQYFVKQIMHFLHLPFRLLLNHVQFLLCR